MATGKLKGGLFVSKATANAALAKNSGTASSVVPFGGKGKRKKKGSPMSGKGGAGMRAKGSSANPSY
jgi:hypothetical protein